MTTKARKTIAPSRVASDLWRLDSRWASWMTRVEDASGEMTDALEAELESISVEDEGAIESAVRAARFLDRQAAAEREEARAFAESARQREEMSARLKRRIASVMETSDRKRLDVGPFSLTSRVGVERVVIDDEDRIPRAYLRVREEIDRREIASDLKAGREVDGAHLERGEPSLLIK